VTGCGEETFSRFVASNNAETAGWAVDLIDKSAAWAGQEGTMIRRDVVRTDRDQKVVKWALVASVIALSLGCFAEVTMERHAGDTTPASQTVQAQTSTQASITG
jgi:hypothetical protein